MKENVDGSKTEAERGRTCLLYVATSTLNANGAHLWVSIWDLQMEEKISQT